MLEHVFLPFFCIFDDFSKEEDVESHQILEVIARGAGYIMSKKLNNNCSYNLKSIFQLLGTQSITSYASPLV